ncbi:hypothetical protein BZG36_01911 [Bifiguratus adelaidae]|uniref:Uncharacterized protein n=1 Tax=Bifiguratus adelaidae TaxID=1938954 RepID=A0A261Y4F7_9FUNG|nr:hypothetical protein BZG36_01911 [Bifiguratus adelaidae]
MECESCEGCFSGAGSCGVPSTQSKTYKAVSPLIRLALKECDHDESMSGKTAQHTSADPTARSCLQDATGPRHTINDICHLLSHDNYSSYAALAAASSQLSPRDFLSLADHLLTHNITGLLIAWAWSFAKENASVFKDQLERDDPSLIHHINGEAEIYEVFNPAVGPVGRCI